MFILPSCQYYGKRPIAIFPKSVLSWNVSSVQDINEDSLSLFCTLEPKIGRVNQVFSLNVLLHHITLPFYLSKIDILVIGLGDHGQKLDFNLIKYMREKKICLEIGPTERACATFNFLNVEGRCVAGAMIPPTRYRINEDDVVSTKRRNRDLLKVEDYPIV